MPLRDAGEQVAVVKAQLDLDNLLDVTIIIVMPMRYAIIYAPETLQHIAAIERPFHLLIRKTIEERLSYEPNVRTRNRKPLVKPSKFGEAWELRFGPENRFRVFYRLEEEAAHVIVLAIAIKVGNRLYVGGKEYVP